MPQPAPAIPSITFRVCAWHILTGLCDPVTVVLCPIFQSNYFQIPVSMNVAYVQCVRQHLHSRLYRNVSYISEGTYLGLDLMAGSPIFFIGENAPWVPIKQSGEKSEVYGYQGKQNPPEILERGTYAATYDVPAGGAIILAYHSGLGRKNHRNVSLLPPFVMIEAG